MMEKLLVINADDFGLSRGINRGIIDAHRLGVVTSTSLMVDGPRSDEAVMMSRGFSDLGLGLHFVATDENGPMHDLDDLRWIAAELERQWQRFIDAVGTNPTHLDSHHHVHRRKPIAHLFNELSERHGVPLRRRPPVKYWGFHAQWEYGRTDPDHVSAETLIGLLAQMEAGAHEVGCHPGFLSDDFQSIYHAERELEVKTLTDARVRDAMREHGITLLNYRALQHRLEVQVSELTKG